MKGFWPFSLSRYQVQSLMSSAYSAQVKHAALQTPESVCKFTVPLPNGGAHWHTSELSALSPRIRSVDAVDGEFPILPL